jgi:hypothetical protein
MPTTKLLPLALSAALVATAGPPAPAQTTIGPAEAADNATIQSAGPRTGANGKAFFNIQGSGSGTFASFGVADFTPFTVPAPAADLTDLTVRLVQANAAFTAPGPVNFYFATDTATSIQPGASPLTYQTAAGPEGVGTQLGTLHLLGQGNFTGSGNTGSGTIDTYMFSTFTPAAESYILNQLNTGGPLRLVATPTNAAVSATWAGFSHSMFDGPILSFGVVPVPEPAGVLLACACAGLPLLARRLRTARSGPRSRTTPERAAAGGEGH